MESNLINFSFSTLPCFDNDSRGKTEEKINKIRIQEDNLSRIDICNTREDSIVSSSILERKISNTSVSQTNSFSQTSESSDLSKNGIQYYFSETIENIKQTNLEKSTEYTKSKNYLPKKCKTKKNISQNENKTQFMIINCQLRLICTMQLNKEYVKAFYIDPFLRYHCFYFRLKSIISSDNTENIQSISEDKNDDGEAAESHSQMEKKEDQKKEEQELGDKARYPRKQYRKGYKNQNKNSRDYYYQNRNNYYKNNNYNNYFSRRSYNHFHKYRNYN